MRRRFALVFNSTAGHAIPRLLDGVVARLRASGMEVFQVPARSASEAAEQVAAMAREDACDVVIAAGGDGTFRAVATGAAGTTLPVGIIPLGTGNVLAHEIGLPLRASAVAEVLLAGQTIDIRGGLFNGAPFFLMTGAGLDARVVARLNYRTKRALGRAAYTYPAIKTFYEKPQLFDVDLDGRLFEASWLILTFASHYGSSFVLTRETRVGLGTLIAVVVEARSRRALASGVLRLALGGARTGQEIEGLRAFPVKHAQIGRRSKIVAEVDGDPAGLSPAEVHAEGPLVRLVVPAGYVADLTNRHANHLACES